MGIDFEHYLGQGIHMSIDLAATVMGSGGVPLQSCWRLHWYPFEGVELSIGYHILTGRLELGFLLK